ncbi:hypothetical protein CP061683_1871 [Chlamydia psittaci 06-1683]|nr:hypothetical protein CP061683_1871 [Chlamydia psittaci 06-1683]EPP37411.1 hypothetical protein CP10743SC13_1290 [Chlamydia psittaci 10_743_SC13]
MPNPPFNSKILPLLLENPTFTPKSCIISHVNVNHAFSFPKIPHLTRKKRNFSSRIPHLTRKSRIFSSEIPH